MRGDTPLSIALSTSACPIPYPAQYRSSHTARFRTLLSTNQATLHPGLPNSVPCSVPIKPRCPIPYPAQYRSSTFHPGRPVSVLCSIPIKPRCPIPDPVEYRSSPEPHPSTIVAGVAEGRRRGIAGGQVTLAASRASTQVT
eukprot:145796-Rhodomonas_salina.1